MTLKYDKKINILIAYPYFNERLYRNLSEVAPSSYRLIVDSGAFSAFNCGMDIKLEDYSAFLKKISSLSVEGCVQLDVPLNPAKTKINLQIHRDRGDNVCPVFTRGDSLDYLDQLVAKDEYVFVGGVQRGSEAKPFAKLVLERTVGKKIHYLAFVRPNYLNAYKPYSTDSSSFSSAGRYGSLSLYRSGGIKTFFKKHFTKYPSEDIFEMLHGIGLTKTEIKRLWDNDSWSAKMWRGLESGSNIGFIQFIAMCSHVKYSISAQNKIGTKIYLAFSQECQLKTALEAHKFMLERGAI